MQWSRFQHELTWNIWTGDVNIVTAIAHFMTIKITAAGLSSNGLTVAPIWVGTAFCKSSGYAGANRNGRLYSCKWRKEMRESQGEDGDRQVWFGIQINLSYLQKKKTNKQTKANQWSYLLQQLYCVLVSVAAKLGQQEPMLRRKCWRLAYRLLETLDLASCLCLYSFENLMLNFKMWMTVATDHWLRGTSSCCISIMKVLLFFSMQIE